METLKELREKIDVLDARIVDLLNQRAALSLAVGEVKKKLPGSVFMPGRERMLLDGLAAINPGPLKPEQLKAVYRQILSASRALQRREKTGYLGPEGTFTHLGAVQFMGESFDLIPYKTTKAIFAAVESGECDQAVVPLENSLRGGIGQTMDLFTRHPLFIRAEFFLRVSLSLLSKEKSLAAITRIYAHTHPLAQCAHWLALNLPNARLIPVESTAVAVSKATLDPAAAAVAPDTLANGLDLIILAKGLEELPDNWTRFVVIGRAQADRPGPDKSSLLFSVPDAPGSLTAALGVLAGAQVDLIKLECRTTTADSRKYPFFADLARDLGSPEHSGLLEKFKSACAAFKFLGGYPAGDKLI